MLKGPVQRSHPKPHPLSPPRSHRPLHHRMVRTLNVISMRTCPLMINPRHASLHRHCSLAEDLQHHMVSCVQCKGKATPLPSLLVTSHLLLRIFPLTHAISSRHLHLIVQPLSLHQPTMTLPHSLNLMPPLALAMQCILCACTLPPLLMHQPMIVHRLPNNLSLSSDHPPTVMPCPCCQTFITSRGRDGNGVAADSVTVALTFSSNVVTSPSSRASTHTSHHSHEPSTSHRTAQMTIHMRSESGTGTGMYACT